MGADIRAGVLLLLMLAIAAPTGAEVAAGTDQWAEAAAASARGDHAAAVAIIRPLAEDGHPTAQYNLGNMYRDGRGVSKDSAEAVKWYAKAAEQGYPSAQYNLGLAYETGSGAPQDSKQAVKWWRKASEQGHPSAQFNLGLMYAQGRGITRNYVEAHKWFNLAADADLATVKAEAIKNRDLAATQMTAAQIANAEKRAADWRTRKALIAQKPTNVTNNAKPALSVSSEVAELYAGLLTAIDLKPKEHAIATYAAAFHWKKIPPEMNTLLNGKEGYAGKVGEKTVLLGSDGTNDVFGIAVESGFDPKDFEKHLRQFLTLTPLGSDNSMGQASDAFKLSDGSRAIGVLMVTYGTADAIRGTGTVGYISAAKARREGMAPFGVGK